MYKYQRLSEKELLGDRSDVENTSTLGPTWREPRCRYCVPGWVLQIVFFLISCAILFSGLKLRYERPAACRDWDFAPQWSPVLEAVKDTGHLHRFDGSFATPNEYKGTPNPLIDGAWDRVLMANGTQFFTTIQYKNHDPL